LTKCTKLKPDELVYYMDKGQVLCELSPTRKP
jgi:hypothetical protein